MPKGNPLKKQNQVQFDFIVLGSWGKSFNRKRRSRWRIPTGKFQLLGVS
jgi:hypothetical protein